ncbi:IS-excision enhancer IEE [Escherichia coli]|nr:IS-excision enhancer IEE [Escherichia coli]
MPKGGFGNQIALSLLKGHRGLDGSILLITPSGLTLPLGLIPMNAHNIEPTILRAIPVDSIREAFQAIYTDDEDIV